MDTLPKHSPLHNLPKELHLIISSFLPPDDGSNIRNLSHVSSYWRRLLWRDRFKTLSISIKTEEDTERLLKLSDTLNDLTGADEHPEIQHLYLSVCQFPAGARDEDHEPMPILTRLRTICRVAAPHLQTYCLYTPYNDSDEVAQNDHIGAVGTLIDGLFIKPPPHLRELTLKCPAIFFRSFTKRYAQFPTPFPKLTHLHVISADSILAFSSSQEVERALDGVTHLRFSHIFGCDNVLKPITNTFFRLTGTPGLSLLQPDEARTIDNGGFFPQHIRKLVLHYVPYLKELVVDGVTQVQLEEVEKVFRRSLTTISTTLRKDKQCPFQVYVLDDEQYSPEKLREEWLDRLAGGPGCWDLND